jgi:hypothetical protein
LPKGNRFAIVTNAGGPCIMATDATIRHGLELTTLRPETIESVKAKLPPTANFHSPVDVIADGVIFFLRPPSVTDTEALAKTVGFSQKIGEPLALNISTAEEARDGFKKITNGVKQRAPGARLLGVEANQVTPPGAEAALSVNSLIVHGKGEGGHVADVRIVLTPSQSP